MDVVEVYKKSGNHTTGDYFSPRNTKIVLRNKSGAVTDQPAACNEAKDPRSVSSQLCRLTIKKQGEEHKYFQKMHLGQMCFLMMLSSSCL